MQLVTFLSQAELDCDATQVVTQAFDEAWQILEMAGGPLVGEEHAAVTRTWLAKHIIRLAMRGERDLDRLIDGALDYLDDGRVTAA